MKKLTNEEFIQKALIKHKGKYVYEKVEYINSKQKVIITCLIHGDFLQNSAEHLNGNGCPNCRINKKSNTEEFINKANKVHNNLYDYSTSNYIDWKTNINIICKSHGIFTQSPNNHLRGKGCSKCGGNKKLNSLEFIEKANKVHNELYIYDKVNYINTNMKIDIICRKHGDFTQSPYNHLMGKGCPKCNFSKGEIKILNFLTENNIKYIPQKTFEDCKYKTNLEFDFYLPDYNMCIEYDGEQHYEANKFFGIKSFKLTKIRDEIKNNYCLVNKIKLMRIPYFDYLNVNAILGKEILLIN